MKRAAIVLATVCAITPVFVSAQSQIFTTQREDRSGDGPEKGPPITASVSREGGTVRVLVAANDIDGTPVPCTFYVNNHFFAEQADPPQGIFVGPDVATIPFTVKILCRDLWGNATMARLAITDKSTQAAYDCTFRAADVKVEGADVAATQVGNSGISISYQGSNQEVEDQSVTVNATVETDSQGKASASVTYTRNGVSSTVTLSGAAELKDDEVTIDNFTLVDEESNSELSCS